MGNFRVGSKVRVPRLNWNNAEIFEVIPFWGFIPRADQLPRDFGSDDFRGAMYLVVNLETDETHECASGELIVKA